MPLSVSKKTSDQDSAPTVDTAKFDELVQKFERVNMGLDAQTKRTDILTTLVAALSNNLANTTAEQRNIRRRVPETDNSILKTISIDFQMKT